MAGHWARDMALVAILALGVGWVVVALASGHWVEARAADHRASRVSEVAAPSTGITAEPAAAVTGSAVPSRRSTMIAPQSTTDAVPFETVEVEDPELAQGQETVLAEGAAGEKVTTWSVTTVDGEETAREMIGAQTVREPMDRRIAVGTAPVEPAPAPSPRTTPVASPSPTPAPAPPAGAGGHAVRSPEAGPATDAATSAASGSAMSAAANSSTDAPADVADAPTTVPLRANPPDHARGTAPGPAPGPPATRQAAPTPTPQRFWTPSRQPSQDAAPTSGVWHDLAQCESSGDWSINTGNGYYGGLQFSESSWKYAGGTRYAPMPHQATPAEQIATAEVLRSRGGWKHWPACSVKLGLR